MVAGLLVLGMIAGFFGAGTVLVAGGGWLLALAAYSGIGATGILLAAVIASLGSTDTSGPAPATAA